MHRLTRKSFIGGAALIATITLPATPALGHSGQHSFNGNLTELNGSGGSGSAQAIIDGELIRNIELNVTGLDIDAPHAQHIHYGDDARNECPTLFEDDDDNDGLLSTVEGQPAYGPIVVSLTTDGDTTPASALAVSRFPVSTNSAYAYSRNNISFTDVSGTGYTGGNGTAKQIADSIREGEGVVVVHGVDHNGNGIYDGEPSELDASLPREATDPAVCGLLLPADGVADGLETFGDGLTELTADFAVSLSDAIGNVAGLEGVSDFEIQLDEIVVAHESALGAAFSKFATDLESGQQKAVARDNFINAYQTANAQALNSLHHAKDALNDKLNRAGAGESKNAFNNEFNTAVAGVQRQLEVLKNDFNDVLNNAH